MVRPLALRTVTLATLPFLSLVACGGSDGDAKPAPTATPVQAAAASAPAPSQPAGRPVPAPEIKIETASPVPSGIESKATVATVNGRPIVAERVYTVYQMNKSMLQQRGRQLSESDDQALKTESLEVVVADELLYQAALAKGIKAARTSVTPRSE